MSNATGDQTRGNLVSFLSVVAFFAGWEAAYQANLVNPVFFSAPSRIVSATRDVLESGTLIEDLSITLTAYAISILIAAVIGVLVGLTTGVSDLAYRVLNPFIVSLNALPKIVLMPMVLLWFGLGLSSKVFLGALMAGFPIIVNVQSGMHNLERDHIMLARSFGASKIVILRSIVLPSLVPYLLAGLRVGVTYAMVGVLIVEFFASSAGIGYRMVLTTQNFQIDAFFVLLIVVIAIILGCTSIIKLAEKHFGRWRPVSL
jgi:NitT/TauT family transport system permease protein